MKTTQNISQTTTTKSVANAVKVNHSKLPAVDLIQTRLKIGEPGDKYEVEADRMADTIMNMPEPIVQHQEEEEPLQARCIQREAGKEEEQEIQDEIIQRQEEEEELLQTKPFIQTQPLEEEEPTQAKRIQMEVGKEEERELQDELIQPQAEEEEQIQSKPLIQKQAIEEEEELVQTKNNDSKSQSASPWIESQISNHSGNGSPLSGNTKSFMEDRFGSNFESVRIHTGSNSVEMNRQLNAQAFTVGSNIHFNTGKFSPESSAGKHLLAHELTHVIQQGSAPSLKRKPTINRKSIGIQRGIMDDLRSMGTSVVNAVTSVAQTIGSGVSSALSWIRSVGSLIESGIESAWNWIRSVSRIIGTGIQTAFSWVRNLSRVIGVGVREAFSWIQGVARHIGMGIRSALSWLTNIGNLIGSGIRDAYDWIRNLARAIGVGFRPSWSWILSVAHHIGLGLRAAWNFVSNVAVIIGLGIRAAWRFLRNLGLRLLTMGIIAAFQWLVNVATRVALDVMGAFFWLVNLTRTVQTGFQEAWNFILRVATTIAIDVLNALIWLRRVAHIIGRSLRIAWDIIQRIASAIGRSILRTWEWIQEVAQRIRRSILAAWEWIQNVARLIGRTLVAAWNFASRIIISVGRAIVRLINWLIAPLPTVVIGNFRNSGSTSSKNNCNLCPLPLGQSTTNGTNGMELRGDISGHNPLIEYDFKRTKERATWKKSGTSWTQLTHVGPGADDDSHNSDEDLTPDSNQIFVIDTPGFTRPSNPVGDSSASEAVYKASFVETVKAKKLVGAWTTVSNSFSWHSISWFENVGGSWGRKAGQSEIETGSTAVGAGDP